MSEEVVEEKPAAFEAVWRGDKPVVSAGGYVHTFVVPFEENDAARRALGGSWQPDDEVRVAIVRIKAHGG